jgi:hypothetical protein
MAPSNGKNATLYSPYPEPRLHPHRMIDEQKNPVPLSFDFF